MARKKTAGGDASTTKPKQLRKRLHKTELELAKAEAKRDKAQARVEALAIIADEIRAQLAESEKAAASATERTATSRATANSSKRATSRHPTPPKTSTGMTSK